MKMTCKISNTWHPAPFEGLRACLETPGGVRLLRERAQRQAQDARHKGLDHQPRIAAPAACGRAAKPKGMALHWASPVAGRAKENPGRETKGP